MHKELSSRSFTEAMLRLAADRVCICFRRAFDGTKLTEAEYTPAGQDKDTGAHGGMDRDVLVGPGSGDHGAGIYEIEDAEYVCRFKTMNFKLTEIRP
jgi:hypothetical protein